MFKIFDKGELLYSKIFVLFGHISSEKLISEHFLFQ